MTKHGKRLLPIALAALVLTGCAMPAPDSTTTRYKVAIVAKNDRESEFWNAVFTGAEAAATEYNMQLTVSAPNNEENYEVQNRLIAKAVEDGAQAIVFSAIDYEENAVIIDPHTTRQLNDMFEADKLSSFKLTPESWNRWRTPWKKFVGWVAHLLTPFL